MDIKLEDNRFFTIGLTIYLGCNAVCVCVCVLTRSPCTAIRNLTHFIQLACSETCTVRSAVQLK